MNRRSRRLPLYSLTVNGRDLHFLRHLLTALVDHWNNPEREKMLAHELTSFTNRFPKAEAQRLLRRVDECLFRVIPAFRRMKIYDVTLHQMEPPHEATEASKRK